MADKYLDINGLAYYKQKTDNQLLGKVDKETGKGLSTNDYTTEEKTKLSGIETGAQVNDLEGVQVAGTSVSPVNKIANIPAMTGAASDAAGAAGVVPAPASGDHVKFLRGDGSWQNTPIVSPSDDTPAMDGTGAAGSSADYSRKDHVHPTDTSRSPVESPTFTGTPSAPTAAAGTNTTQIATTAFVRNAVDTAVVGAKPFQGIVHAGSEISSLTDYESGWYWNVGTAGTYVGKECEIGDQIVCISDFSSAYSASDFDVLQANLSIEKITNAEIDTIFS